MEAPNSSEYLRLADAIMHPTENPQSTQKELPRQLELSKEQRSTMGEALELATTVIHATQPDAQVGDPVFEFFTKVRSLLEPFEEEFGEEEWSEGFKLAEKWLMSKVQQP